MEACNPCMGGCFSRVVFTDQPIIDIVMHKNYFVTEIGAVVFLEEIRFFFQLSFVFRKESIS